MIPAPTRGWTGGVPSQCWDTRSPFTTSPRTRRRTVPSRTCTTDMVHLRLPRTSGRARKRPPRATDADVSVETRVERHAGVVARCRAVKRLAPFVVGAFGRLVAVVHAPRVAGTRA